MPAFALALALGVSGCGGGETVKAPPAVTSAPIPEVPTSSPAVDSTPDIVPPSAQVQTPVGANKLVEITYYSAFDNDPPGSTQIAHPTALHPEAGGIGTYADPVSFASAEGTGEYPFATIIYVPQDKKYYVRDDTCAVSATAINGCGDVSHVDLYIKANTAKNDSRVTGCEDQRTPDGKAEIIVNPAPNLEVDATLVWNPKTNSCSPVYK